MIQTEVDKKYTLYRQKQTNYIPYRQKQIFIISRYTDRNRCHVGLQAETYTMFRQTTVTGRNIHHVQTDNCHRQKHTPCSDRQLSQAETYTMFRQTTVTGRNIHHVQTDNCHRQKHTPCSDRQLSPAETYTMFRQTTVTGRNIHHVQTDNCHRQKHTPCSDRQLSPAVLSFQSDQDWSNPSSRVLTNPVSGVKVSGSMIRGVPRLSHQTARASGLNRHRIS